jgi:hypothetical protein
MAKRRAKAGTRKSGRKTQATSRQSSKKSSKRRATSRPARKATPRKRTRPKARVRASRPSRKTTSAKRKTAAPSPTPAVLTRQARETGRAKPAALARERRRLREDETVPGAPSQLGYSQKASGAESGQAMYQHKKREHTEGGPALTGGDVDTDWNEAYASGEETPGGDMSTPDQDVVEEIGRALGVEYEDAEELKGAAKIEGRDRHRWEYDPASAEDYKDRNRRDED